MALTSILRVAVTLAVVIAAAIAGWWLWTYYTLSPWTRDARMLARVVSVAPDVSGQITEMALSDNQKVAKGDVLFVIDQQRFTLALDQAEATLADRQAALKLAEDDARRDADVLANDPSAISGSSAENSRIKADEARAAQQLAEAGVAQAKLDLERSTVRAGVNGYVTNLTAGIGDYATAGNSVLALVDRDSFYVYAYFMETKLPAITVGAPAEIRLMAGGTVLQGTVQGISRAIANPTAAGGLLANVDPNFEWIRLAQRIPVRITLDEVPPDVDLISGLSATVVVKPIPAAAQSR